MDFILFRSKHNRNNLTGNHPVNLRWFKQSWMFIKHLCQLFSFQTKIFFRHFFLIISILIIPLNLHIKYTIRLPFKYTKYNYRIESIDQANLRKTRICSIDGFGIFIRMFFFWMITHDMIRIRCHGNTRIGEINTRI